MSAALDGSDLVRERSLPMFPDPCRVYAALFMPGEEMPGDHSRATAVIERVLALDDLEVSDALADLHTRFADHPSLYETFRSHFEIMAQDLGTRPVPPPDRQLLIGAYFTHYVSPEGTALTNPSIVAHPDQAGVDPAGLRFVLSARAIGEGHISSVEFRTGMVTADGQVRLDRPGTHLDTGLRCIADDNYTVTFASGTAISDRILVPGGPAESNGIEDARMVRFVEDDGGMTYEATYTAYDGRHVTPRLLRTDDFRTFTARALCGPAAKNKGMALFPRRIGGRRAALSRWDRERSFVAWSDDGLTWDSATAIQTPRRAWELVQVGNCGSPLETPEGWLVLTHGVGPMRTYSIGAMLLDLDDPRRVRSTLPTPLIAPGDTERTGYVPNVVYTCGGLLHDDRLVVPYGVGDQAIRIAVIDLAGLLTRLAKSGPPTAYP